MQTVLDYFYGKRGFNLPLYAVLGVAIAVAFAAFFVELLDSDEMLYALVARELLQGNLPYQRVFEHKPVGLYYIYALFFTIFDVNFFAIRAMTLFLLSATAMLVFVSLRKLEFGRNAQLIGAVTSFVFPMGLDGLAGNTEVMLSFVTALLFCVATFFAFHTAKRTVLAAVFGACVALGFAINYLYSFLGLFAFVSLALYLLFCGERIWRIVNITIIVFIGFVITNVVIYFPYIVNLLMGGDSIVQYFQDQKGFHSNYRREHVNKRLIIERVNYWIVPFLPILVGAVFSDIWARKTGKMAGLFGLIVFVAACIAASVSLRFYNHYWVMASIPLAIMASIAIERANNLHAANILRICHSLALLYFVVAGSVTVFNHYENDENARPLHEAMHHIRANIHPDDNVLTISTSPVHLFLNDLKVGQKYQFEGHVAQLHDGGVLDGDQYFVDELAKSPDFVFIDPTYCTMRMRDTFPNMCEQLFAGYALVASFEGVAPVAIYSRKSIDD